MPRCPSCDYPLPDDRDRLGARCPSCRDPLYEPPGRLGRPVRPGEAACGIHPHNESVGICSRCGNYYCEICRCNWQGQLQCVACVDRALSSLDGSPQQSRTHFRQSLSSLVLGLASWGTALALLLVVWLLIPNADNGEPSASSATWLVMLASFAILGLMFVALFGVGQGAAAIRTRGNHMIMAHFGLILSGLYVGVLIGIMINLMLSRLML